MAVKAVAEGSHTITPHLVVNGASEALEFYKKAFGAQIGGVHKTPDGKVMHARRAHEASNLHLAGLLVARSAMAREESRGAHYRMDYPDHDDKKFLKHSVIRGDKVIFVS